MVMELLEKEKKDRKESARAQAKMNSIIIGIAWIFGGVIATLGCSCLSLIRGSGGFIIASALIMIGIMHIIRGLRR
jgi:hypothetical protein